MTMRLFSKKSPNAATRFDLFVKLVALIASFVLSGCSSNSMTEDVAQVRDVKVISSLPRYVVKEICAEGCPKVEEDGIRPRLRINTFGKPPGSQGISSSVRPAELRKKLNPEKSYKFYLFTTFQESGVEHVNNYNVTLSKVEEDGEVIVDASVCAIHHCPMQFVKESSSDWEPTREDINMLEKMCPNHGYALSGCGSPWYFWAWRCPKCAKKLNEIVTTNNRGNKPH